MLSENPAAWNPHGQIVEIEDQTIVRTLRQNFEKDCYQDLPSSTKLIVEKIYAIENNSLEQQFEKYLEEAFEDRNCANIQLKYHGTRASGAKGIICDGFKLPNHSGMFGRGLYFA